MLPTWDDLRVLVRAHLEAAKGRKANRKRSADLRRARRAAEFPLVRPLSLELVLSNPEERLVVYGTLVPGGKFHHLLADIDAAWERCLIRGRLGTYRGYPSFKWNPTGEPHPAWLVTSSELPAKYKELDDFEGRAYIRRLIPAETEGRLVIAYVYEGRVKA
jgi:gamma-glutamylcyclotransferase (GGCT)/AIG2-like uncharacterized protein YtfP|uniref:Gamma-glutamylcyclotransferase n=1 Tax=Desulfobacca acetoxidans TaxID=60893 RepID=A0A7C3ZA50_9BACT